MNMHDDNIEIMISAISELNRAAVKSINVSSFSNISAALNQYADKFKGGSSIASQFSQICSEATKIYSHLYSVQDGIRLPDIQNRTLASAQAIIASYTNMFPTTSMINSVRESMERLDIDRTMDIIDNTLKQDVISTPNLAFVKISNLYKYENPPFKNSQNIINDLTALNRKSALHLAKSSDTEYERESRRFGIINTSSAELSILEMNETSSACILLEDVSSEEQFSESDMMNLMSCIAENPMHVSETEIGKRIQSAINKADNVSYLGGSYFYHARAHDKGAAPYTSQEMKLAPWGKPAYGRFNVTGQPFYYVTDAFEEAGREVLKHVSDNDGKNKEIQTARLITRGKARLLDLSAKSMRGLNTFLKYIRFPLDEDSGNRPRSYLIPSYVAECCRLCGFDGIKYYGGKDYSNYVLWDEHWFDFDKMM